MKKLHLRTLLISLVLIGSVLWACKEKPFCDPVFDATFNETGEKFEIGGWGNIGVSGELIDNYTTKKLRIEWIDTCRIGVHYSFSDTMINAYYRLSERTDTTWYREKYYTEITNGQITLISGTAMDTEGYEMRFSMQFVNENGETRTIENGYAHICNFE